MSDLLLGRFGCGQTSKYVDNSMRAKQLNPEVVAQLVERLLPTSVVRGLNSVMGKLL